MLAFCRMLIFSFFRQKPPEGLPLFRVFVTFYRVKIYLQKVNKNRRTAAMVSSSDRSILVLFICDLNSKIYWITFAAAVCGSVQPDSLLLWITTGAVFKPSFCDNNIQ